jgi:hypothetical protein
LWWYDPAKEEKLNEGMTNNTSLPVGELDQRYWPDYLKEHDK